MTIDSNSIDDHSGLVSMIYVGVPSTRTLQGDDFGVMLCLQNKHKLVLKKNPPLIYQVFDDTYLNVKCHVVFLLCYAKMPSNTSKKMWKLCK